MDYDAEIRFWLHYGRPQLQIGVRIRKVEVLKSRQLAAAVGSLGASYCRLATAYCRF